MRRSRAGHDDRLVVGVTVGVSADLLLRGQLAWFRENGWDVTLVSSPDVQAQRAAARESVRLVGIPMERGISPLCDLVALVAWIRLLRSLRPGAVNVGTPKAALLGTFAAWLVRVPRRVYTVRGLRLEGAGGLMGKVLWAMEWLTIRAATDVLFVSPSLAAEVRRRGLPVAGKARLVGMGSSNGVDSEAVATRVAQVDRSNLRSVLGFGSGDFVVGVVGRISKDKGVDVVVRACRSADLDPRVRVLLVGSFEESQMCPESMVLPGRITHLEWTDDLWGILGALDALCLPTRREGFPNVVLEAGAAGLPVVTTRATGAIDSVIDGQTGYLIAVDDDVALVDRLNYLASDSKLAKRMGEAGRARVVRDFRQVDVWQGISDILSGNREATAFTAHDWHDEEEK